MEPTDFFDLIAARSGEIVARTAEHLWLTGLSVFLAIIVGVSLGIVLSRRERLATPVLGFANVVQTIPSIALLGVMIPLVGIGATPAIIALFLYALLPIIRNTTTGIADVDPAVREAGRGLGMTDNQLLRRVELPLALPVIFAGVRTATVINVGVATLCALIAAGGLGEFIFTGIALNNTDLILLGAIPAALLALLLDAGLGLVQRNVNRLLLPLLITFLLLFIGAVIATTILRSEGTALKAGLPAEFMERPDGWEGLKEAYGLELDAVQMNAGLMYDAVKEGEVDVIGGYSTDGRIEAYRLRVLVDDRGFFPPYYAAPLVRESTLQEYPDLGPAIERLAWKIDERTMRRLNYQVDWEKREPKEVAREFLKSIGEKVSVDREGEADIRIGGKNFTEQFILAEIYALLIENNTGLTVDLTTGLGGTQIVFEALRSGEIDLYPEYTGTGFLVLLTPRADTVRRIIRDRDQVYDYVKRHFKEEFDLRWMSPIGFNNTYALMMRARQADEMGIGTISDL